MRSDACGSRATVAWNSGLVEAMCWIRLGMCMCDVNVVYCALYEYYDYLCMIAAGSVNVCDSCPCVYGSVALMP